MDPWTSQYGTLDTSCPINWRSPLTDRLCYWLHMGFVDPVGIFGEGFPNLTRRWEGHTVCWGGGGQSRVLGSAKPGIPGHFNMAAGSPYLSVPWGGVSLGFGGTASMDDVFTRADAGTVLAVYRHKDTTARNALLAGASVANAFGHDNRLDLHVPWGDGNIYFDFGGTTDGVTRLTVSSYTKDTDWHWWAFVVGDGEGMRVYRDGVLLASNSATPSRNLTRAKNWEIGHGEFGSMDEAELAEIVGFNRGLSHGEVVEWMRQSQAGHPDTLDWRRPNFGLTYWGTQGSTPAPGGVLGSVFGGNIIRSGSRLAF